MGARPIVDLSDCVWDSPKFRHTVEENENYVDALENRLEKLIKLTKQMVDSGRMYVSQQNSVLKVLKDLGIFLSDDGTLSSIIEKLVPELQEISDFHVTLLDQFSRSVAHDLSQFVSKHVGKIKESKHHFNKMSADYDAALVKNSQVSKLKQQDHEEMRNMLIATRGAFLHTTLDYVSKLSLLQATKRRKILSCVMSYVKAYVTFFRQGFDTCTDVEPELKKLGTHVCRVVSDDDGMNSMNAEIGLMKHPFHQMVQWRTEKADLQRELESRTQAAQNLLSEKSPQEALYREINGDDAVIGSYLFKRTSNTFRTWHRRWFMLHKNRLLYRKRNGEELTIMEEDLKLCTVKPAVDIDKRFCFEVHSPTRYHVLQADDEDTFKAWIAALQNGIERALEAIPHNEPSDQSRHSSLPRGLSAASMSQFSQGSDASSGSPLQPRTAQDVDKGALSNLVKIPGNDVCADCGAPKPTWASINLGVTLCISENNCSGIHRSLGVQVSKVRSLNLDQWEPDVVKVFAELGNTTVNRVYLAKFDGLQPVSDCSNEARRAWIEAKYVHRRFVDELLARENSQRRRAAVRKWSVKKHRRRPVSADRKVGNPAAHSGLARHSQSFTVKQKEKAEDLYVFEADLDMKLDHVENLKLSSDEETFEEEVFEEIENLDPNRLLFRAAEAHNVPVMLKALALKADKDWQEEETGMPALHKAVLSGSNTACGFLMLNGANTNLKDKFGRTALHHAVAKSLTGVVGLLLRYRADADVKDVREETPLDMALRLENGDITAL
ncbi:unnamed protein product [Notodromas monacha]|uniref:Uncharacterized protein n=1 Tax=Notodromas monacha TaxID=399045 RepID=A0A7R9GDB8_9CRUS|nr:unnamed protein product [Notodromas monacha]CAG0918384.1 unnamed protein product [Notodromas monacha]